MIRSYDNKDWQHLRTILASSLRLNYRGLKGPSHTDLTQDEYCAIIEEMIGDEMLKTQPFLGGAKWECLSDGSVQVAYQLRAAHIRYANTEFPEVVNKGHGLDVVTHWYKKIEGVWKLEGCVPSFSFYEGDIFGTLALKGKAGEQL